jgi:nucleoside-diphosphate-sugar epimerase
MKNRAFIIGASGYVGSAVTRRLVHSGMEISALSRTEASDARLSNAGARPVRGDTAALELLTQEARLADVVIYAANASPVEHIALQTLLAALNGSGKPLIFTSGAAVVAEATGGSYSARQVAEDESVTPPLGSTRRSSEIIVLRASASIIRSMVVRPPLIYGHGGSVQIPRYANCGLKTGTVRYIGAGENVWAFVHVDDLAEMYLRLINAGLGGHIYHTVAGEVAMGTLATAVARALSLPVGSWSLAEAEAWYGTWAARVGQGSSCRPIAPITNALLGWRPERNDILEDVMSGSYAQAWKTSTTAAMPPAWSFR